jgi:hypothetical protein
MQNPAAAARASTVTPIRNFGTYGVVDLHDQLQRSGHMRSF